MRLRQYGPCREELTTKISGQLMENDSVAKTQLKSPLSWTPPHLLLQTVAACYAGNSLALHVRSLRCVGGRTLAGCPGRCRVAEESASAARELPAAVHLLQQSRHCCNSDTELVLVP